jgi:hypothetical protein
VSGLEQGLSLEEIGRRVGRDPSTVGYWVEKHGLVAANRERHAPRGPLSRRHLEELVSGGATIAEIAETVERSKGTVRHWLLKYELQTSPHRGARAQAGRAASRDAGLAVAQHPCGRHGLTDFVLEGRGYYRCKRCRSDRVAERRRRIKATLVAEAGGCCVICGYDRALAALQFHHLDPQLKRFGVAEGLTRSIANFREEIAKCVLLCSNCHAEVEAGVRSLPV